MGGGVNRIVSQQHAVTHQRFKHPHFYCLFPERAGFVFSITEGGWNDGAL